MTQSRKPLKLTPPQDDPRALLARAASGAPGARQAQRRIYETTHDRLRKELGYE